jgi:PAS domain S-box-containing protein
MADGDAAAAALQPVPVQGIGEDLRSVAMEAAPDGILLVDRSGRILLANPAMQAMSGYGAHELLGNPLQMLLPAEAHAAHGPQLQSYFDRPARRPMGQGRDLWLLRKDGQRLSVDIALGHSPHGGGVAVAFVRDLSQLRRPSRRCRLRGRAAPRRRAGRTADPGPGLRGQRRRSLPSQRRRLAPEQPADQLGPSAGSGLDRPTGR